MKKATTILALLLCVVLLIGASVAGTLAFLTSRSTVTNTFTVGKVNLGDDGEAGLDEAKVNEYGEKLNASDGVWKEGETLAARVTSNEYKLIPGHTYTKDPTVHVGANSEACWLFVKVDNGIAAIEAATTTGADPYTKIAEQITGTQYGWTKLDGEENIYYKEAAKTGDDGVDYPVFGNFRLATNADVSGYANANITVTAYAIQKDGLTVTDAWDALEAAYPSNP